MVNKKRPDSVRPFFLRRERDSNPRYIAVQWFSRPPHSTTLPSLPADGKSKIILVFINILEKKNNNILIDINFLT